MLPTLRAERQATYSPVLPISPRSGIVLQVPVEVVNAEAGLIRFEDQGEVIEHCILSGGAKLQWKRSEEHTSELQSLMRISYAVFCLKKKSHIPQTTNKSS